MTNHSVLKSEKQNFFTLSTIQISSMGIPSLALGYIITQREGIGKAIPSILIGNLLLWIIGICVISATDEKKVNGIENIKNYIGIFGSALFSIFLLTSFLNWYSFQINNTVSSLLDLLEVPNLNSPNTTLRIGAAIGIISALLSIGGIKNLKWISYLTLPILIGTLFISIKTMLDTTHYISWGLSFSGIFSIFLSFLPGSLCIPTFFRYSTSKPHSYLALSIVILAFSSIQIIACFLNFNIESSNFIVNNIAYESLYKFIFCLFTIAMCFSNNLMNIYFASACYETFSPKFYGMKGHAIVGLLGTATYAFVQISKNIEFILSLLNCYIFNVAIVLIFSFVISSVTKERAFLEEKKITCIAWLLGCIAGTLCKISYPVSPYFFYIISSSCSILTFFLYVFFTENLVSIMRIVTNKEKKH